MQKIIKYLVGDWSGLSKYAEWHITHMLRVKTGESTYVDARHALIGLRWRLLPISVALTFWITARRHPSKKNSTPANVESASQTVVGR